MSSSKTIKRWERVLLIALMITVPFASAEAAYPPSGRYADIGTGIVYLYDQATGTMVTTPDVVEGHTCDPWYAHESRDYDGRCGNCAYVPDGEDDWQLDATQYTWGRCINLDVRPEMGVEGDVLLRVDVRVVDWHEARWYYSANVTYDTGSFTVYPTGFAWVEHRECLNADVAAGVAVNFCNSGVLKLNARTDPRAPPPHALERYCVEIQLTRHVSPVEIETLGLHRCGPYRSELS